MNGKTGEYAVMVLTLASTMLRLGQEISELVHGANSVISKGEPTEADWAGLNAKIEALRVELHEGESGLGVEAQEEMFDE